MQSLLMALGWGLAPLITLPLVGWLSESLGLTQVFAIAGGAVLLAAVVLSWAVLRRKFDDRPLLVADAIES